MLSKCIDSGYLVGATPLTVGHQLFWNTADVFGMEWRCACGFGIILYFFSLFLVCELSLFFWHEILSKCMHGQWVSCGCNSSYSFSSICLKLCRCFQHGIKLWMWFWYNPLIFFFSLPLQFSGTNLSFSSDSTLVGLLSDPLTVLVFIQNVSASGSLNCKYI